MRTHSGRVRDLGIVAAWSFAEATVFFIIPDVWITFLALRSRRRSYVSTAVSTAAAVTGGIVTYRWCARVSPERSMSAMLSLPAISPRMIERSDDDMASAGVGPMLLGPLRGVPYKIYARSAAVQRIPLPVFAVASIFARWPRFFIAAWATGLVRRWLDRYHWFTEARARWMLAAFWVVNYALYFRAKGFRPRNWR